MTVYRIALIELALCWVLWVWPFAFRVRREPGRKHQARDTGARWGMALEFVSFLPLFAFRAPAGTGRVAASMLLGPVAVVLAWWAVAALGRHFAIQAGLYEDHQLVRRGPYRFLRHPVFASLVAMHLATGLLLTPWPVLAAALAVCIAGTEIRVRAEERLLAGRFGESFHEYRRRTAAYLPWVR